MSGEARDWLPAGALDTPAVRRAFEDAVAGWSKRWFPAARPAAAGFAAHRAGAPLPATSWHGYGTATALAADPVRLAGLALGASPAGLVLSEVDRDILGRFAGRIAADLASALDQAIGRSPPAEGESGVVVENPLPDGGFLFAIAEGGGEPVVHAAVPPVAMVPFRKSLLRGARRPRPALARLGRAAGATPVRIEAQLGAAVLALGDLAALAPGDVLILDRTIEQGAALALQRSRRPFARAAIAECGAALSLALSPFSGEI